MQNSFFSFLFFLFYISTLSALDLEHSVDNFILETKQIVIPEYPDAFNPAIVEWHNMLIMGFRTKVTKDPLLKSRSFGVNSDSVIGIVRLDRSFNPLTQPQLLDLSLPEYPRQASSMAEDPRLLVVDERLFMIYSDNKTDYFCDMSYRVYVAELDFDGEEFFVLHHEAIDECEWQIEGRREKNWVPFENRGKLFLAYSLNPHRILHHLAGTRRGETIAISRNHVEWPWGELRGGTPGISIDGGEYLAFFHSSMHLATVHSEGECIKHYFMGAYTFSQEYPFHITRISKKPIIGTGFYEGRVHEPYWEPVRVIFPGGFIYDERMIQIVYGRQDHEMWVATIDRKKLFDSLLSIREAEEIFKGL